MNASIFVVGQVVYNAAKHGVSGIITAIHGEQQPANVSSIAGGVIVSGGNAQFDVCFMDGVWFKSVPEAILRGRSWSTSETVLDASEIANVIAKAELSRIQEEEKRQHAARVFAEAVETLKADPQFAGLDQEAGGAKQVAKNIRKQLKGAFPGVKFSVRSDLSSVRVSWTDGPTVDKVEAITKRYQGGRFNGMEDIYESSESPFNEVFGSVDYTFCNRERSDALITKAIETLREKYSAEQVPATVTAETFRKGMLINVGCEFFCQSLQNVISKQIGKTEF